MRTERKEKEKLKRKKQILQAAEKVFFAKNGEKATMDDVALEAVLSKGTLYLYFKNKEDLKYALAQKGVDLLSKRLARSIDENKSGIENLSDFGDAFVEFSKKNEKFFSTILLFEGLDQNNLNITESLTLSLVEPPLQILFDILTKGRSDGTIRKDIKTLELVAILWSQMLGLLQATNKKKKLIKAYKIDEDWLIRGHFRLIIKGIQP